MSRPGKHFYEFGPFRVDPLQRMLWLGNQPVPLQPKAFDTLLVLVQHGEGVVLKDHLMKSVWPDTFVEESNLAQNVFVLRKALGETAGEQRYIVTVPGRGYRFAQKVRVVQEAEEVEDLVVESHSRSRVVIEEQPLPVPATVRAGLAAPRAQRAVPLRWALAAAVLVIASALAYVLYRAARPAPAALEYTRVTSNGDLVQTDISPDGKYVAYVRATGGKQSLWMRQLATRSDVQIITLEEDQCSGLAFSPDGSYVYFVRQSPQKSSGDLYQVPSLGGNPRKVLAGISGPPSFSPDGQRFAFVRDVADEYTLLTASLDGSGQRVLASDRQPAGTGSVRVAWSPDGKTLAFAHAGTVLTTIAAEGGAARSAPGSNWKGIWDLTWLPGSRRLMVAGVPQVTGGTLPKSQVYEVSLNEGELRRITSDLSNYTKVRASADGKMLLAVQDQLLRTILVVTPGKESEARPLNAGRQNGDGAGGLAWTPDQKIVYFSLANGRADLWEMGTDGSNPQRLTNNEASSGSDYPAVSQRGGFITFVHEDQNVHLSIWRMDMEGGNLRQLTQGKYDFLPAISPDGRWVVFARGEGGKWVLMKVPSEGGPVSQLTDYGSDWPSVSPDGKWIACVLFRGQNQPNGMAIVPFAGGQPVKVFPLPPDADFPFHWTPDGQAISFLNNVNGVGNIWEQPVAGGPPKPVTHFTSETIFYYNWSLDGRLALSHGTERIDAMLIQNFR